MVVVASQVARACQRALNLVLPPSSPVEPLAFNQGVGSFAVIIPFFIGDTVLSTVLIQHLLRAGGFQRPCYIIGPPHQLNMFENMPGVTACIPAPQSMGEKRRLLRQLNPDAVFLLRYSFPWAYAMMEAGIRYRIGFSLERFGLEKARYWGGLLTHTTPSGEFDSPRHQLHLYHAMLSQLGIAWDSGIRPQLLLSEQDTRAAAAWLQQYRGPWVVTHMTGGSPGKRWPFSHWETLVHTLNQQYHASFVAMGTAQDAPLYDKLADRTGLPVLNLCGQTTLRQSAALCSFSTLVITLDTAVAHLAAAVEAPRLVVLYGPTNYRQWCPVAGPKTQLAQVYLEVPCRPCITRTCYHRSCIRLLSPQRVLNHIQLMMPPQHPA